MQNKHHEKDVQLNRILSTGAGEIDTACMENIAVDEIPIFQFTVPIDGEVEKYVVRIIPDKNPDSFEAWLGRTDLGMAMMMFGLEAVSKEEFINIVFANLHKYTMLFQTEYGEPDF